MRLGMYPQAPAPISSRPWWLAPLIALGLMLPLTHLKALAAGLPWNHFRPPTNGYTNPSTNINSQSGNNGGNQGNNGPPNGGNNGNPNSGGPNNPPPGGDPPGGGPPGGDPPGGDPPGDPPGGGEVPSGHAPEPATWVSAVLGAGLLGLMARRRRSSDVH
ncbi:MAG: PEP-CTERM sorting domain-containing protein [Gemmataceae bacterium]|nr:PEP-CTERM sorting domain-containing protein [Gemmataceae bacterium]